MDQLNAQTSSYTSSNGVKNAAAAQGAGQVERYVRDAHRHLFEQDVEL